MNLALYPHLTARYQPDRPAIEQGERVVTYGGLEEQARRIALGLCRAGIGKGDLCGLLLRDDALHLAALFAIWRIGAIVLPLDWRARPAELALIAERLAPRALIAASSNLRLGGPPILDLETLAKTADAELPVVPLDDEPALYGLSSGTTGEPKATVITHRQHDARLMAYAVSYPLLSGDRYVSTLPIAYNWGRNLAISNLCLGATLILHPLLFAPEDLVQAVERGRATTLAVVPNVSRALLRLPVPGRRLMEGLRLYVSSGAPLFAEERSALRAAVSANLTETYGATETGAICFLHPEEQDRRPSSVGRPVSGAEVDVVDGSGRSLGPGEIGRVRVRGPSVASGYVGSTPADAARFRDGWFYASDDGRFDDAGFLHLEGRDGDLIKHGGLSVYPAEIERVLNGHPGVAEAAVAGLPSAEQGEEVVAFVVLREALDPRMLARHCRLLLAPYKLPRRIKVVESLPRSPAGKVLKSVLIEALQREPPAP
jgi:long-chain acyl-CoA synthetase